MTRSSAEQLYLKRLLLENLSSNANLRYLVPTHAPELAALYGETKLIVASISTRTELGERLDDILALVELSRYEGQEAQVSQLLEAVLLCPHVREKQWQLAVRLMIRQCQEPHVVWRCLSALLGSNQQALARLVYAIHELIFTSASVEFGLELAQEPFFRGLLSRLLTTSTENRLLAVQLLGSVALVAAGSAPELVDMLLRCAQSSTIPVRQEAVRCLWDVWFLWPTTFPRHELSSSEPLDLLSYLQDDDCVVIKASIIGVGRVLLHCPDRVAEDREHVVALLAKYCALGMRHDPQGIAAVAGDLLCEFLPRQQGLLVSSAVFLVLQALDNDDTDRVALSAAAVLLRHAEPKSRERLRRSLEHLGSGDDSPSQRVVSALRILFGDTLAAGSS